MSVLTIFPTDLRQGVRVASRYKITIEASAHNGKHPFDEMIKFGPDEDFQFASICRTAATEA